MCLLARCVVRAAEASRHPPVNFYAAYLRWLVTMIKNFLDLEGVYVWAVDRVAEELKREGSEG